MQSSGTSGNLVELCFDFVSFPFYVGGLVQFKLFVQVWPQEKESILAG